MRIVTVSSGATTTQALTSGVAGSSYQTAPDGFATSVCACVLSGIQKPRTKAPCAAATVAKNSRRVTSLLMSLPHQIGGEMNRLPDTVIGATPAGVGDARVDVGVGGRRAVVEERERRHDHPRLAVAALRCVEFLPRHLNRMRAVGRYALDGQDRLADGRGGRDAAGADGAAVDVHGARTALPDAAAEFRAGQADVVTDDPQQRRLRIGIDVMDPSVDGQVEWHPSSSACRIVRRPTLDSAREKPRRGSAGFVVASPH